jgi:CspA family cold shock protein
MTERLNGIVKWFKADKGFGFIECKGDDYFVHFSNIKCDGFKSLSKGENVSFTAITGKKGKQADEVEIVSA